ncbi:MAG: 50S ribosomal protein L10 [Spirochaetes bacterium]|nr:50S ribosomal protein L10 [Spirochaetota bacterium]
MVKQYKIDEVGDLVSRLKEKGNFFLTDYSGVRVKGLSALRKMLREKNAEYKVVKNNLFKRAIKDAGLQSIDDCVKGPVGVAFVKDEVAEVAKILQNFKKDEENFSYTFGLIDNVLYNENQIKMIADLPSKEVLLSQTMSLINGPARGIAVGVSQIMASLARGIKAVAEAKNQQ